MMADHLLTSPPFLNKCLSVAIGDGVWSSSADKIVSDFNFLSASVSLILEFYSDLFRVDSLVGNHLLSC